ncbi:MAG TPA: hypothetical protein VN673_08545 [Clostridia bacterium]|nr:hypothetical protein [Clostridia bacterium]
MVVNEVSGFISIVWRNIAFAGQEVRAEVTKRGGGKPSPAVK